MCISSLFYNFLFKGGLSTWSDYPYCSGDTADKHHPEDNCMPCPAPGFNASLCGPPVPYCNMSQSCVAKLNKDKFVNGLQLSSWKAIDQVWCYKLIKMTWKLTCYNISSISGYNKGLEIYHNKSGILTHWNIYTTKRNYYVPCLEKKARNATIIKCLKCISEIDM